MASNTYKVIALKGTPVEFERKSMEAITPGHLVQPHTDGLLKKHATAAGNAAKTFALETKTPATDITGNAIDAAWASGDRVQYGAFSSGSVVNALLAASATAVVVGNPLESAGDGTLRLHSAPANLSAAAPKYDGVVAYAEESVDNSAGSSVARIAVLVA